MKEIHFGYSKARSGLMFDKETKTIIINNNFGAENLSQIRINNGKLSHSLSGDLYTREGDMVDVLKYEDVNQLKMQTSDENSKYSIEEKGQVLVEFSRAEREPYKILNFCCYDYMRNLKKIKLSDYKFWEFWFQVDFIENKVVKEGQITLYVDDFIEGLEDLIQTIERNLGAKNIIVGKKIVERTKGNIESKEMIKGVLNDGCIVKANIGNVNIKGELV